MISLDEGQQVLHWRDGAWHRIAWQDWTSFRALNADFASLPYVTAGEHRFVVCIVEDGRLFNILPHRYPTKKKSSLCLILQAFGAAKAQLQ